MLSMILEKATGKQLRLAVGSNTVSITDDDTQDYHEEPGFDEEPSSEAYRWDAATRSYVALPSWQGAPITRTVLSRREFRNRVGVNTRVAINMRLEGTDPNDAQPRAILRDLMDSIASVAEVDLTNTDTIAGVNALVSFGYKTEAEATAILAPSTMRVE